MVHASRRAAEYGNEDSFRISMRDRDYDAYPRSSSRLDPTVNPISARASEVVALSTRDERAAHDDVLGKVLRATEERERAANEYYRVAGNQMDVDSSGTLKGFVKRLDEIVTNVGISHCSAEDLLELKSAVYDMKVAYDQVDLARRFVLLKDMISKFYEKERMERGVVFNGKSIVDMIELCDHILEAQGNCEPVKPQAGEFFEAPKVLTCCAPLLFLYRCLPQSIRQAFLDSGWSTIVTLNEDNLADADMGLNAMGIICALLMTVPFGLLGGASASFWDELRAAVFTCAYQHGTGPDMIDSNGFPTVNNPNGWLNPSTREVWPITNWGWSYDGIRREFLAYISLCIFSSLNCVLLSTTYYVFHRGGEKDPRALHGWWKRKGYLIVVFCGILTIVAVSTLFALTKNVYVYYSVNLGNIQPLLDEWWSRPSNTSQIITKTNHINYLNPGAIPTGSPIFISDVCSANSLEFAAPAVISVVITLVLGLYFVF